MNALNTTTHIKLRILPEHLHYNTILMSPLVSFWRVPISTVFLLMLSARFRTSEGCE